MLKHHVKRAQARAAQVGQSCSRFGPLVNQQNPWTPAELLAYSYVSHVMRTRLPTSGLRDGRVGGGLHRHGRAFADGGGGEVSEARLSSHSVSSRTAPVAEGVLDNRLENRANVSDTFLHHSCHFSP